MQRFFLSFGIFLGSCLWSISSPLFKPAPKDPVFSGIHHGTGDSFQKTPGPAVAIRPPTAVAQGQETNKAILILATRNNRITVYSGSQCQFYTVATEGGAILAEWLTRADLKSRFPELYDIVTGTAWAGEIRTP
jgi:hypothetical protein